MDQMLIAGLDGGNTKTEALVADEGGRIVGYARGGPSNIHALPQREALGEMHRVLTAALNAAFSNRRDLCSIVLSVAGADWPEDFTLIERSVRAQLRSNVPVPVLNDALGPLRLATSPWVGISVVCGTFNAIGARGPGARQFHLGSWPDSPGGQELSRRALKAVLRDHLRVGRSTLLRPAILERFGLPDVSSLLHALNRRHGSITRLELRELAPLVFDVADAGDAVAAALVEELGETLAAQARVAAREVCLDIRGAEVLTNGGLFQHRSGRLFAALSAALPEAQVVQAEAPPVAGALLLALDAAGIDVDRTALAAQARRAVSIASSSKEAAASALFQRRNHATTIWQCATPT